MESRLRIFVYSLIFLLSSLVQVIQAGTVRNRYCFHHRHYNKGGVCLLSSYGFVLEYANSSYVTPAPFDNFSMMEKYMIYHNTLETVPYISASHIRSNPQAEEKKISKAINDYCIARLWSGYIQIENFHNWLTANTSWCNNIKIVERKRDKSGDGSLLTRLSAYLKQNADPNANCDYVAIICYQTDYGPHSVLLGYDNSFFIRDVNFIDRFVDNKASFDFEINQSGRLFEYLLFCVTRSPIATSHWKSLNYSLLQGTPTGDNRYSKTSGNIKIKHLRFDHSNTKGPDGTIYYTGFLLKSHSNPNLTIEVANYFPAGYLRINEEWQQIGMRIKDSIYEYDLEQLAPDLYIDVVQPNVDFSPDFVIASP